MKKTLKKDITKYDNKMRVRVDKDTIKAVGISLTITIPIFILLLFIAGMIIGIFISFSLTCVLILLQIGKVDGTPLLKYIIKILHFAFFPKSRKKCYSHDSGEYRIKILTERELKQKERKNI